jgi:tetratricopeptide (TPR) repeat protein
VASLTEGAPLRTLAFTLALCAAALGPARAAAAPPAAVEDALEQGKVAEARVGLADHLRAHDDDVEAHELWIDLAVSLGEADVVRRAYAQRAQARPADPDAAYLAGRAEPAPEAARAAYEAAIKLAPAHARAWMGVGALERVARRPGAAVTAFERALKADPSLVEAWNGLRKASLELDDMRGAEAVSRRALAATPGDEGAWLALAMFAPTEAPKLLGEAVGRFPDAPQIHVAHARALFENGLTKDALAAYDKVLDRWPDRTLRAEAAMLAEIQSGALTLEGAQLALSLRERRKADAAGAEAALREAVRAHPRSAQLHHAFGNLLAGSGQAVAAEAELRQALSLDPRSPELGSSLGMLLLGQRRAAEALPLLSAAASARPEELALSIATAMAEAGAGQPAAALARLEAAEQRHPRDPGPALARARLLLGSQREGEAVKVLLLALERLPDPELFRALLIAARAAGQQENAALALEMLAEATSDPRYTAGAAQLRAP